MTVAEAEPETSLRLQELTAVTDQLGAAEAYLRSLQEADGHWCGELEGDSILESEYALTLYFLGRKESSKFKQLANYLRSQQTAEGGWSSFPGGPNEVSVSTKAYFVLKLDGDLEQEPHMQKARDAIRSLGGLDETNSYTHILLSIFGVSDWESAPAVPPELILLPRWFYFNIYAMSAWSRAIVVPLSIIWAHKPSCPVPSECRLNELRIDGPPEEPEVPSRREAFWRDFFTLTDRGLKAVERLGLTPLRTLALRRAEAWVEKRLVASDGLAAIFPSIMNTVIAFVCLGRDLDDPVVAGQLRELEKLEIQDGDELRLQPCLSPVWDTALAMNALLEAGSLPDDPALQRGAAWLLDKEVSQVGDWQLGTDAMPGGWYFEYANEFYPDCDDTAEVIPVLERVRFSDEASERRRRATLERAVDWLRAMQSRNGGWGAFDKDCDHEVLELVPFADHNAMIDPPTVDVSSRSIEALIAVGVEPTDAVIRRAVSFLHREQEEEGAWYGRWGSNYIYGTWLALCALATAEEDMESSPARRAVEWLLEVQNSDGGWGESLRSYDDPATKGQGPSTAAQTSWALMGLLAADRLVDPRCEEAARRGVAYLLGSANDDGVWYDSEWTGTGFPRVFYLRYHLYACYFPLQALAIYRRALEQKYGIEKAA